MLIDNHNHIWVGSSTGDGFLSGRMSIETILHDMDIAGIDMAGVCSVAQDIQNDYVLRAQQEHSDRFFGFVFVNPRDKQSAETLKHYLDQGLKGLKLHPRLHGYPLNSFELVAPLLIICREYEVPVFIHGAGAEEFNIPFYFEELARSFPDLQMIIGHMGMFNSSDDAIIVARRTPNLYLDTSLCNLLAIKKAIAEVGTDRLLMGTDWPGSDFSLEIMKIRLATEGNPAAFSMIAGENFRKLARI